jgi:hypothetical protein
VVNLLGQAVTEIAALVPPSAVAAMGVHAPTATVKHWNAKDFKKAYNEIASRDPRLKKL